MLFPELALYVDALAEQANTFSPERRVLLDQFVAEIAQARKKGPVRLVFICTHNSRRSHLAQLWAAVMAKYWGLNDVQTWSGGTEATAFHPNAVAALERAGFRIQMGEGDNPVYEVFFSENEPPLRCFSKVYDHPENPSRDFAAIMTCSDADENCPFIPGASWRLSLTYADPKIADGTAEEAKVYGERMGEIGAELWYVMAQVAKQQL